MSAPLKIGARVFARRLGKADVRGEIVWVGPSKFGDGWRYRVRAADGSQHWTDEKDLTVESNPANDDPTAVRKGSRVLVTGGAHEGIEGDVYIVSGEDRFGVRDDFEKTYWVDGKNLALA